MECGGNNFNDFAEKKLIKFRAFSIQLDILGNGLS